MRNKPDACKACPINHVTTGFVPLTLKPSNILIVGEAPGEDEAKSGEAFVGPSGSWLNNMLKAAGWKRDSLSTANVICCRPPANIFPTDVKWTATSRQAGREAVEYCKKTYLEPTLQQKEWSKIFAVGDHALQALTPRKGILVWRGSPLPLKGRMDKNRVIPLLHPSYLMRDAKMVSTTIRDMRKSVEVPPENYNLYATHTDLAAFSSTTFAFDFEWDRFGNITLCGLSDKFYGCTTGAWNGATIPEYKRIFTAAKDLIGHNIIGADTRYFERLGWDISGARLHDTMLKQHLVQPDMKHSLLFVGSVFTNKPVWKGRGKEAEDADGNLIDIKEQWKTWDTSEAIPRALGGYGGCTSSDESYRLYNARDTDASFQVNLHLDQLLNKYGLEDLYWNVAVPIAHICRDINERGIKINPSKVKDIRAYLSGEIIRLDATLPVGLRSYEKPITKSIPASPGLYKPKELKCRGTKKEKTSHEQMVWTVNQPGPSLCGECGKSFSPTLTEVKKIKIAATQTVTPWNATAQVQRYATTKGLKQYINRKRGTAAADKNARKSWGRELPEFRIVDKLKALSTERNNFAKEQMESLDRLYFEILTHGTSEGRFSSKGKRQGIDPNIQNQPPAIRKIYIPDQDHYSFIELDYASGENMLTAFLAKDWERLERLKQPDYSEHHDLACQIFNLPTGTTKKQSKDWEGKDLYGVGKILNHGGNYGMSHKKVREELESEGFFFSEADCKDFVEMRKKLNPRTAQWQEETIALAKRDGSLRNPFGRMRWFSTRDVATKSLAFLPASTLADIIIRAMIAHYPQRFKVEVENLRLERLGGFMPEWFMNIQVHDSLVLQGPNVDWQKQADITKAVMTQPWKELDGFSLDVEVKAGGPGVSWGELEVVHI